MSGYITTKLHRTSHLSPVSRTPVVPPPVQYQRIGHMPTCQTCRQTERRLYQVQSCQPELAVTVSQSQCVTVAGFINSRHRILFPHPC